MLTYPFTEQDAQKAYDDWGANCGPNALAFAMGLHIDKVKGLIRGFDSRGYTSPTMMRQPHTGFARVFGRSSLFRLTGRRTGRLLVQFGTGRWQEWLTP
jgi:hypothetical protein